MFLPFLPPKLSFLEILFSFFLLMWNKSWKLYTCLGVSMLNIGAITVLSTCVLIHFSILLGKLWLRHWDAIQYLRSIVVSEWNIISIGSYFHCQLYLPSSCHLEFQISMTENACFDFFFHSGSLKAFIFEAFLLKSVFKGWEETASFAFGNTITRIQWFSFSLNGK